MAEVARVKAELESQAAEVVAEDEEADKDQRTATDPFAGNGEVTTKSALVVLDNPVIEVKKGETALQEEKKEEAAPASVEFFQETTVEVDDPIAALLQKLAEAKGKVVDKRANGGALWVIGGKNLAPIMKEFKVHGINFIFKAGGGKATGGKDGWWAKTDVQLPVSGAKKTVVKPIVESKPAEVVTTVQSEEKKEAPVVTVAPKEEEKDKVVETMPVTEIKHTVAVAESNEPIEYVAAEIPSRTVATVAEFAATSKKNEIAAVINEIVAVEAPILKDTLMRKVFSVFGVNKTNVTAEAFEKALKVANTKNAKLKGIVFCWKKDQEPNDYMGIRISNDRAGEEIAPQEIRNAICYVLKSKGCLAKDDLIKETSLLFGYKRLGRNI